MWAIIKFNRKNIQDLKKELSKKLGEDFMVYSPKIFVEKYRKNKLIKKEFDLLGDYLFCFHKKFENPEIINSLKFTRGLKYFLNGFNQSQTEIQNFISKCKQSENQDGYLTQNFCDLNLNSKYKFCSGPFSNMIFKIIEFQKNKINILLGNVNTVIRKDEFIFNPA